MKKTVSKKITAILLSVLILLPVFAVAASAANKDDKKQIPEISIHGFMAISIYEDPDDPDSNDVWPPTADSILAAVKATLPALTKFSVTWNWDQLADAIIPQVNSLFYPAELNSIGLPTIESSGIRFNSRPDPEQLKSGRTIDFRYDWRVDPMESAAQLNDFIDYVLEATGAEQVTLTAHSLGGVIMLTYLTKYGYDKVKSVCFNTSAVFGETYTGELLSGNITLNGEALLNYIKFAVGDTEYEYFISKLSDMLAKAGLLNFVAKFGNLMIEKLSAKIIPTSIVPLFAHWLTIWAMVPDEYMDACLHYVFEEVMGDQDTDYTVLRNKIETFNSEIRAHKTEMLQEMYESDAISLYVISRYGYTSIPLTPAYNELSDGVIETRRSSFGATTAPYGQTLSAYQIQGYDKYISPDGTVDANTCMFPDQTWFIRNYKHATVDRSLEEMIDMLLYYDGQADIHTFEEYPQFLEFHAFDKSISPDSGAQKDQLNFFERFKKFFSEFFRLVRTLFSNIFSK